MGVVININSFKKAENLINKLSYMSGSFDLRQGRYIVNAKSIMGILSLDLDKPMEISSSNFSDEQMKIILQDYIDND